MRRLGLFLSRASFCPMKCVVVETLVAKKQSIRPTQITRPHYPIWVIYRPPPHLLGTNVLSELQELASLERCVTLGAGGIYNAEYTTPAH